MNPTPPALSPQSTMAEVLQAYPGAQRALFTRYHIGGCRSCAFSPQETLEQVCVRNDHLPVAEVIQHIQENHNQDQKILIAPLELAAALTGPTKPRLVDVRTREEHEAVRLPGSVLMTQDTLQEAFALWDKQAELVVYDHEGSRSLDAAAYFIGHGFGNARALRGGIDAYSREADPSLPRYRLEVED